MNPRSVLAPLAALLLLVACSEAPPPPAAPRVVLVQRLAEPGAVESAELYTGEIRARYESPLAFRIGGKLVERKVEVGSEVRRGQVLARLDPRDAELGAAAAAAQVAAARADAALAVAEYERAVGLRAQNFISGSALDARRSAREAAEAKLRQAEAQAAAARNQSGYTALVADSDGVVTALEAEVGQVLAEGQAVMTLARPGNRELLVHAPEGRMRELVPGREAEVRLWSAPLQTYRGRVREVAPMADAATRTYALRIALPDAGLPLGATASATFHTDAADSRVLPAAAVTRAGEGAVVWVVDNEERVRPVAVEVLAYDERGATLRGGPPAGTRVVIAGVHKLVEGEAVRAVESGAPVALDAQR